MSFQKLTIEENENCSVLMYCTCLSVHEIAWLQRRGVSNTKTTYHFSKYRLYKLITSRGIPYHPAQLLLTSITLYRDIY
jgi:hypothetical protein